MNTGLWILQGLLALVFLLAGGMKLTSPIATLQKSMEWVSHLQEYQVRGIGVAEILGAIGLILPPLLHFHPKLTPIAATCLAVLMLGAIGFHLYRKDAFQKAMPALILFLLVAFVAYGRFFLRVY